MRRTVFIALVTTGVASSIANPAIANENLYNLSKVKTEKLFTVKSRNHIDAAPMEYYDKFLITVTGDGGFEHKFESDVPSISLHEMEELPYDGTYSYEISAVRYVGQIKDTMNNGRSEDTSGYISVINSVGGQFKALSGEIQVAEEISEPKRVKLPVKPLVNPFKQELNND